MSTAKDFFVAHAARHSVEIEDNWTTGQICDALVAKGTPWPEALTNDQGWQLYTATLRHELGVKSIKWDEVTENGKQVIAVTFTMAGKREWVAYAPREQFVKDDFGKICAGFETDLRAWNETDLAERQEALEKMERDWDGRAPDLMNHLIGFRAWNLDGAHIRPIGVGDDVWRGGQEVRANCQQGGLHVAPDPDCECGLYAWTSFEEVAASAGDSKVYGAVQAWGRVEVHDRGFRAQFMRPVILAYDDSEDQLVASPDGPVAERGEDYHRVKRIAQALGGDIEVIGFHEVELRARDYGMLLTREVAPELYPPAEE